MVKPYPDAASMSALVKANAEVNKAAAIGMKDFRLKILHANILVSLCYQYGSDESWKIKDDQVTKRRAQFNSYKKAANEALDELIKIDSSNSFDYEQKKVKNDYPIR